MNRPPFVFVSAAARYKEGKFVIILIYDDIFTHLDQDSVKKRDDTLGNSRNNRHFEDFVKERGSTLKFRAFY